MVLEDTLIITVKGFLFSASKDQWLTHHLNGTTVVYLLMMESQLKDLCSGSASKDKWLTHHLTGTTMVSLLMLLKYLQI